LLSFSHIENTIKNQIIKFLEQIVVPGSPRKEAEERAQSDQKSKEKKQKLGFN